MLGAQARLLRRQRPQPLLEPTHLGAGADPFEHDQWLAPDDPVAVAHQYLANDPALEMLHGLPAAFGADHAGRDRGAGERRHRGPAAAEGEGQDQHDQTRDDRPAQIAQQARGTADRPRLEHDLGAAVRHGHHALKRFGGRQRHGSALAD
jgi:hypothetical protein